MVNINGYEGSRKPVNPAEIGFTLFKFGIAAYALHRLVLAHIPTDNELSDPNITDNERTRRRYHKAIEIEAGNLRDSLNAQRTQHKGLVRLEKKRASNTISAEEAEILDRFGPSSTVKWRAAETKKRIKEQSDLVKLQHKGQGYPLNMSDP